MKNNENEQNVALKVSNDIQEFLESFQSVSGLSERAAKGMAVLVGRSSLCVEDRVALSNMVQDYMCLLDILKPMKKGGEV